MNTITITATPDGIGASSLAAAREQVRRLNGESTKKDIDVVLKPGEYYLSTPLRFGPADGGSDSHRVRYRAKSPGTVRLSGGDRITGWERHAEGVYTARVDAGWVFHSLSENGARCPSARYPDTGYRRTATASAKEPRRRFGFAKGDIPRLERIAGARVFLWAGGPKGEWNWSSDTIPIESIDYDAGEVILQWEAAREIGAGSRYFIENDMALLTAPGEFYLDVESSTLFYRPRNEPIDEQLIVAPRVTRIIEICGTGNGPVRNVSFEGIEIALCDTTGAIERGATEHGAVHIEGAEGIEVLGCHIHHTGYHGVLITGASKQNTIRRNLIHDIGHTGVQINGPRNTRRYLNFGNVVDDNHIHDTGRTVGHGSGVQISNAGENRVTHNLVHDTPRYSISIKGPRPGTIVGTVIDGIEVTRENAHEFIHSRSNTIAYNDMSRANTDSQDTGVFETWGPGRGNVLDHNRLHHSDIHFSFGFGIYLDDAANWMTVTNNIIDHLQEQGAGGLWYPIVSKGLYNTFTNNIVANNHAGRAAFGSQEMAGEPNRELSIRRNVFCDNAKAMHGFIAWTDDRYAVCDENLYFDPSGVYTIDRHPEVGSFDQWREYENRRFDSRSIVADPMFVDPERGDYRFHPNSPVFNLGVSDIDQYAIGLTEAFPFAPAEAKPARLFVVLSGGRASIDAKVGDQIGINVRARSAEGYPVRIDGARLEATSDDERVVSVAISGPAVIISARKEGMVGCRVGIAGEASVPPLRFWVRVLS